MTYTIKILEIGIKFKFYLLIYKTWWSEYEIF